MSGFMDPEMLAMLAQGGGGGMGGLLGGGSVMAGAGDVPTDFMAPPGGTGADPWAVSGTDERSGGSLLSSSPGTAQVTGDAGTYGPQQPSWFDKSMLGRMWNGQPLTEDQLKSLSALQRSAGGLSAGRSGAGGAGQQRPTPPPVAAPSYGAGATSAILGNLLQQHQNAIGAARAPRSSLLGG